MTARAEEVYKLDHWTCWTMDVLGNPVPISQIKEGRTAGECDNAEATSLTIAHKPLCNINIFDAEVHLGDNKIVHSFIPPVRRGSANGSDVWGGARGIGQRLEEAPTASSMARAAGWFS